MSSISTGTGDMGECALLFGRRVSKSHIRIRVNGALDEWSTFLGGARSQLPKEHPFRSWLREIQICLIGLMGEVAVDPQDAERFRKSSFQRLTQADLDCVQGRLAELEANLPRQSGWSIPGDFAESVPFEVARALGRRAERELVSLYEAGSGLRPLPLAFVNRCSDLLWIMARVIEAEVSSKAVS